MTDEGDTKGARLREIVLTASSGYVRWNERRGLVGIMTRDGCVAVLMHVEKNRKKNDVGDSTSGDCFGYGEQKKKS